MIITNNALFQYLQNNNSIYYGKSLELHDIIKNWLAYIPKTFPHYTRHTIEHSEEIIRQMSKLLFKEEDVNSPVVRLSSAEVYILIVSAFLHDAGMVVSDKEKIEILASSEWKEWTTIGGGAKRWNEIKSLREDETVESTIKNFIADLQTRFLIAEFIRRNHHLRAADFMTQNQSLLGNFAFNDPVLLKTISDVCIAHGLNMYELEDNERYPDRRDIRGETVNVRFMAIILRIADLLDMTYDRACPLLMNAACPLPAESFAHWSQYTRITHRLTSHDRIELSAKCETQEEHRYLRDWCQWLVDEINNASKLVPRMKRHSDWKLPHVSMEGPDRTIVIEPSDTATYKPYDWKFDLDHDAVIQRFVHDTYGNSLEFIRELLQNAFDATRCKMYDDLVRDGIQPPEYLNLVNEDIRNRYIVKVSLEKREVINEQSGETETKHVLVVEDQGIGMDVDVIRQYFLQIGRSYYTTKEFRSKYGFVPTSRFGVGFLSVFSASDFIKVETYKPSSSDGPLCLTLTGPKSYLLVEKGNRKTSGTKIEVFLKQKVEKGTVTTLINDWCKRVEFPVIVKDFDKETVITAENPEKFIEEIPNVLENGSKFVIRSYSIEKDGVFGELYLLHYFDSEGEVLDRLQWATHKYPLLHPKAIAPKLPNRLICNQGITVSYGGLYSGEYSFRIDIRNNKYETNISRNILKSPLYESAVVNLVKKELEKIIIEHLKKSQVAKKEGWRYIQRLIKVFPDLDIWNYIEGAICYYINGRENFASLEQFNKQSEIAILTRIISLDIFLRERNDSKDDNKPLRLINSINTPTLIHEINQFSETHFKKIVGQRSIVKVNYLNSEYMISYWSKEVYSHFNFDIDDFNNNKVYLVDLPNKRIIGHPVIIRDNNDYYIVLNSSNAFVKWLLKIKEYRKNNDSPNEVFKKIISLFNTPLKFEGYRVEDLNKFLKNWPSGEFPEHLAPPMIELSRDMFKPQK